MSDRNTIYTIGRSTCSLEEFIKMLQSFNIETLAHIRRHPDSRKYPHFNKDNLIETMPDAGINYVHFEDLGGQRKAHKRSVLTKIES